MRKLLLYTTIGISILNFSNASADDWEDMGDGGYGAHRAAQGEMMKGPDKKVFEQPNIDTTNIGSLTQQDVTAEVADRLTSIIADAKAQAFATIQGFQSQNGGVNYTVDYDKLNQKMLEELITPIAAQEKEYYDSLRNIADSNLTLRTDKINSNVDDYKKKAKLISDSVVQLPVLSSITFDNGVKQEQAIFNAFKTSVLNMGANVKDLKLEAFDSAAFISINSRLGGIGL